MRQLSVTPAFLRTGSSPFLFANTSGRGAGRRARLLMSPLKENDTHCIGFLFYPDATLNVYVQGTAAFRAAPAHRRLRAFVFVAENGGPLALPVFNASGHGQRTWNALELAVSTFWPNLYQVTKHALKRSRGSRGFFLWRWGRRSA